MNSHCVFPSWAYINWDKSNPHCKEYQHAEGDKLCLIKIIWQLSCQKSHYEAHAGQDPDVSKNTPEANFWTRNTLNDYGSTVVIYVVVGTRWTGEQPDERDYYLSGNKRQDFHFILTPLKKPTESVSTWTDVPKSALHLCWLGPNHFMALLPGSVDLNAIRTTAVLARRHEMQRAKLIPNAGYLMRQSQSEGSPMNNRPTRKHTARNTKRRKLNSMLLARTSGVSLHVKNMARMERDIQAPQMDTTHSTIPIKSW